MTSATRTESQMKAASEIAEYEIKLEEKPNSIVLHCELAWRMQHIGRLEEAIRLSRRATELAPQRPAGWNCLAAYSTSYEERMEAARMVVKLWNPQSLLLTSWYAWDYARLLLEPRYAETQAGSASPVHPSRRPLSEEESELYHNGIRKALDIAWERVTSDGESGKARLVRLEYRLGLFFRKMQPYETYQPLALHHFQTSIKHDPTDHANVERSKFWIATMGVSATEDEPDTTIEKCPHQYIVDLYSTFASKFDEQLVGKLNYQTPTKLRGLFDEVVHVDIVVRGGNSNKNDKNKDLRAVIRRIDKAADLGCGTGLSGLAFRSCISGSLIGVDLSPEMIEKAREREGEGQQGCYDELHIGDICTILSSSSNDNDKSYNLIFSCDVFCYVGNLQEVFDRVFNSLVEASNDGGGGVFAFSTELLLPERDDEEKNTADEVVANDDFLLQRCGRFAHSQSYIQRLADACGFETLKMKVSPLRKNGGKEVVGLLAILRRPT